MAPTFAVTTPRLGLRPWAPQDRAPFAAMNADAEVMRYYPRPLEPAESDERADRVEAHIAEHGFGLWTAQLLDGGAYLGFIGLQHVPFETAFTPAVELGWRLRRDMWGHGYATEGARAAAGFAFAALGLDEVVAMAHAGNTPSIRVMQRIGMSYDGADDFELDRSFERPQRFVLHRLRHPASST